MDSNSDAFHSLSDLRSATHNQAVAMVANKNEPDDHLIHSAFIFGDGWSNIPEKTYCSTR